MEANQVWEFVDVCSHHNLATIESSKSNLGQMDLLTNIQYRLLRNVEAKGDIQRECIDYEKISHQL